MTPEKLDQLKKETVAFYKRKPETGTGVFRHVGFDDNEDYLFNSLTSLNKPFAVRKVDVAKEYDKLESFNLGAVEFQHCPRLVGTQFEKEDQWWDKEINGDRTCSGCGSYHPKEFIEWLDKAIDPDKEDRLDMTTKGYKFYVHKPGVSNASQGAIKVYLHHIQQYIQEQKLSQEDIDKLEEKLNQAITVGNTKHQKILDKMSSGN